MPSASDCDKQRSSCGRPHLARTCPRLARPSTGRSAAWDLPMPPRSATARPSLGRIGKRRWCRAQKRQAASCYCDSSRPAPERSACRISGPTSRRLRRCAIASMASTTCRATSHSPTSTEFSAMTRGSPRRSRAPPTSTSTRSGIADGLIRLWELGATTNQLAVVTLAGNPAADDVVVHGSFAVAGTFPGAEAPFQLGTAQVALTWPDVADPSTLTVSASAGPGEDLLHFLNVDARKILSGLSQVRTWLGEFGASSVFDTQIPFAGHRTLGQVLDLATAFADQVTNL